MEQRPLNAAFNRVFPLVTRFVILFMGCRNVLMFYVSLLYDAHDHVAETMAIRRPVMFRIIRHHSKNARENMVQKNMKPS